MADARTFRLLEDDPPDLAGPGCPVYGHGGCRFRFGRFTGIHSVLGLRTDTLILPPFSVRVEARRVRVSRA